LLKAYIIGIEGKLRNPQLPAELAPWFEIVHGNGYLELTANDAKSLVNAEVFEALLAKEPTTREVACFLAHLQAWRWLAQSDETCIGVFEDDVHVYRDMSRVVGELSKLRGPWQVSLERRLGDFLWTHLIPRPKRIWKSRVQPRGAGAYIISKEAARALVADFDFRKKFDGVADASLMQTDVVQFRVCLPPPMRTSSSSESLIGARNPKLNRFSEGFRRMMVLRKLNSSAPRKFTSYLSLKMLKALKYCFSLHFATAWLTNLFQSKR
jgi:GR25 family glycosyltransferase involved in LPS biosynthesis